MEALAQLRKTPILLLILVIILLGGAAARFYAYREATAFPTALIHVTLALAAYCVLIYMVYQRIKVGKLSRRLTELFIIFSLQLGVGTVLGFYRLELFDIGRFGEVSIAGLHFLLALVTLILIIPRDV